MEDIGEHYRSVKVVLDRDYFRLFLFAHSECVGDHYSPRFRLSSHRFPESIMQMSSAFSARLTTLQELFVFFHHTRDASEEFIPWRQFLLQFPSVKALRMEGTNNLRIASVLHQDHGGFNLAFLPALEEIELCTQSFWSRQIQPESGAAEAAELAAFQPFVSARRQASRPVRVFWGPPLSFSRRIP